MSHLGQQHHHDDAWWRRLYADDGATDPHGEPSSGSLDEHFATVRRAFEGTPVRPPVPAQRPPEQVIHVGDRPPTYDAEPTAWPCADPDRLTDLVPDTVLDGAHYGRLTVRAASGRGDSARYRGAPRADAVLTARFGTGDDALLFIAVAGGARAAEDAPRAARDACHALGSAVGRNLSRLAEDIRSGQHGALKSGLRRLTARAYGKPQADGELPAQAGEFVVSLRCLLLPVDPDCRTRVSFGLGPGGLFRLRAGEWQDLDPDAEGEEAGTRFRFRASVAQCGDTLLLCSAGLAEPLRETPELSEHLARRWGRADQPPGLAAFLADTATRVKGYADDRTAVAVWES
jgi:hypothetical protein